MPQRGQIRVKFLYLITFGTIALSGFTLLTVRTTAYRWMLSRKAGLRATLARARDRDPSATQNTALRTGASTVDRKPLVTTLSGFDITSDGVPIHYLEEGKPKSSDIGTVSGPTSPNTFVTCGDISFGRQSRVPTLLIVPGWTLPAWIWQQQIDYFSKNYRVVAMDPCAQGESSNPGKGVFPANRARDIKTINSGTARSPVSFS